MAPTARRQELDVTEGLLSNQRTTYIRTYLQNVLGEMADDARRDKQFLEKLKTSADKLTNHAFFQAIVNAGNAVTAYYNIDKSPEEQLPKLDNNEFGDIGDAVARIMEYSIRAMGYGDTRNTIETRDILHTENIELMRMRLGPPQPQRAGPTNEALTDNRPSPFDQAARFRARLSPHRLLNAYNAKKPGYGIVS